MNIEIANRLVQYRKKNNLSQEQLAEKIGVSRQAVSKWERSEASPDTDNLILLARLYNVSLDELLMTDDEIPVKAAEEIKETEKVGAEASDSTDDIKTEEKEQSNSDKEEKVHIGRDGIHIKDNGEEVHVSFSGVKVRDRHGKRVDVGFNGVRVSDNEEEFINWDEYDCHDGWNWNEWKGKKKQTMLTTFPYSCICIICYLLMGFFLDAWSWSWCIFLTIPIFHGCMEAIIYKKAKYIPYPILMVVGYLLIGFLLNGWWWGWLLLLTIPIFEGTIKAVKKRNPNMFPYPVLTILVFLSLGMFCNLWHPGWVVFLTVPLYYWFSNAIRK